MLDGVRFAETDEEYRASYQLRYRVYVEGMGRLKSQGDHILKELRDEYDETARAVIAIKNGIPIGTLRLFWGGDAPFTQSLIEAYRLATFLDLLQERQICIAERLMVDEEHRGSSITLRMYKEVMHFVLDHYAEVVLLDCQPHHLNSYLKLGFRPFTKPFSYPGIGIVIPMVLIVGDYKHLKHVGSPFAILTREEELSYCRHVNELQEIIGHTTDIISLKESNKRDFFKQIYSDSKLLYNKKPKIFDDLSEVEISRVIEKSHIIQCSEGDYIIDKDEVGKTIFVVLSGVVEIKRDGQLQAIISPGEVIGEITFFLGVPSSADIVAATNEVRILSLDDASMSHLLKFENTLAIKIYKNLCRGLCSRVISNFETPEFRSIGDS
jgi:predicted GNAT family N-acyltransferase